MTAWPPFHNSSRDKGLQTLEPSPGPRAHTVSPQDLTQYFIVHIYLQVGCIVYGAELIGKLTEVYTLFCIFSIRGAGSWHLYKWAVGRGRGASHS